MNRRQFLVGAAGALGGSGFVQSSAAKETDEIISRSRDRRVRFNERYSDNGVEHATWTIENRHTGDQVFEIDIPRSLVRHSYATDERVLIVFDTSPRRRRTMEWFLQSDMGRSRSVDRDGTTRVVDYHADGPTVRRNCSDSVHGFKND